MVLCSIHKDMTIKPCMCIVVRTLAKSSNSSHTINRTERVVVER